MGIFRAAHYRYPPALAHTKNTAVFLAGKNDAIRTRNGGTNVASFHASVKSAKAGGSAGKDHADYIQREGRYAEKEHAETLIEKGHGNLPEWANNDPSYFFDQADKNEGVGRRVYEEYEIALPVELSREQQMDFVRERIKEDIGNKPYVYGVHEKTAALDPTKKNPHVHIQYCPRDLDGIKRGPELFFKRPNAKNPERGGARKDGRYSDKGGPKNVRQWRERVAESQNQHLERHGHEARVSAKSLRAQRREALQRGDLKWAAELDRPAEVHIGPKIAGQIVKEAQKTERQQEQEKGRALTPEERKELLRDAMDKSPAERANITGAAREIKAADQELRQINQQLDQDRGQHQQQTPPQQQRPEPERPATEPAREQQPAPERTRPEPEHQASRSAGANGPSMDATLEFGKDMDKTRGDQRTADERRAGVALDPEEESRRGVGKGHDALRNLDRSNESPIGQKPSGQQPAPEQRQDGRAAAGKEQQPAAGPMSRDEARRNVKAAINDRAAEDQKLKEFTDPKVAEARKEVAAEAINRDHAAAMKERSEALAKRETAAAQERQQLNKDKPGWLSGEQKQLQHEMRERANANRMEQIAKEREQLERDKRDPAQWDKDRLAKDPTAQREREAAVRERAAAKDPEVKKALDRRDQIPGEKAELGKIETRLNNLKGPTVNADLSRQGVEKAARNPEPVKQKLDQQKGQERENTRDTGRGR